MIPSVGIRAIKYSCGIFYSYALAQEKSQVMIASMLTVVHWRRDQEPMRCTLRRKMREKDSACTTILLQNEFSSLFERIRMLEMAYLKVGILHCVFIQ